MNTEALGQHLKTRRLERNIPLADISAQTRIHARFLEAIERGEFSLLPQSYIRSFLWSYASTIGFLPAEILKMYDSSKTETTSSSTSLVQSSTQPKRHFLATIRPVLVAAVVVAAVGIAFVALRSTTNTDWPR